MTNPISGAPILPSHITAAIATALGNLDYSTWPPTTTGLTTTSGTIIAQYLRTGKDIRGDFVFILGASSAVTGLPTFTLPAAPDGTVYRTRSPIGWGTIENNGSADYPAVARWTGTGSVCDIVTLGAAGTYVNQVGVSGTVPFTFGDTDWMHVRFAYKAA